MSDASEGWTIFQVFQEYAAEADAISKKLPHTFKGHGIIPVLMASGAVIGSQLRNYNDNEIAEYMAILTAAVRFQLIAPEIAKEVKKHMN